MSSSGANAPGSEHGPGDDAGDEGDPHEFGHAYAVFAQRPDARVDIDAWAAHAERFFSTRIGLAEDKRYLTGVAIPRTDSARFVVAPADGRAPGIRSALARPTSAGDLARAAKADLAGSGLALLARRCPTLWLVLPVLEEDSDPLALRLAAILASVMLGPILDLRRSEIFGVKTARARLEALEAAR